MQDEARPEAERNRGDSSPDVSAASFESLISGDRRGLLPTVARGGLSLLSVFYEAGVRLRNAAFDHGWKRTFRADVPVVSVGNITTGGTGKTPAVAFLARWFADRGLCAAILSRGYRALASGNRESAGSVNHRGDHPPGSAHAPRSPDRTSTIDRFNDEKLVLDRLCPGVPHLQDPDRAAAASRAVAEHAAQVLILDDGFQHRRLARDLDIVLIDALEPFGYGRLLPRGLLREPLSGLRRAGLIVLTRADHLTEEKRRSIVAQIAPHLSHGDEPVEIAFPPEGLVNASGEVAEAAEIAGRSIAAFCGIGNPAGFRRTLDALGCRIGAWRTFPDHHLYTADDLRAIAEAARSRGAESIVTTLKDLVKIDRDALEGLPLWAVRIGVRALRGEEVLERHLQAIAEAAGRNR